MFKTFRRILQFFRITQYPFADNTELEIEDRRRNARGSIERETGHLWDAHYDPPAMGRLLQKFTTRTRKDEEIQRAKEERRKRNALITNLSRYEGYRLIIVPFLESIEQDSYFKLRHPEDKPKDMSLEWYNGKQVGRLEVIEDFRLMITTSLSEKEMDKAREQLNKEQAERRRQYAVSDTQEEQ